MRFSPFIVSCSLVALPLGMVFACSNDGDDSGDGTGGSAGTPPIDACPAGLTDCASGCVDVTTNPAHCGSCGNACGAGETCAKGVCSCGTDQTSCGGDCVDLSSDPSHCGSCDHACAADEVCSRGTCDTSCAPGDEQCGQSCVDLDTSAQHCGACDAACLAGQVCESGSCACPGGQELCGNYCTDVMGNDHANCGSCGASCAAYETCQSGSCVGEPPDQTGGTGGQGGTGTGGATGGTATGGTAGGVSQSSTFTVDGSTLRDPCGEAVVLRGANKGSAFPGDKNQQYLPGLAETGANAVRFTFRVIYNNSNATDVDVALQGAKDHGMVAIPALWDATGDWSQLGFAVDFWLDSAMVEVLKKHEGHTLLNIANEAGNRDVTNEQFRTEYASAITRIRDAGLDMPIVIDAAHWGRDEDYILDNGQHLLDSDPHGNVLFSWHPWDVNQPASRYETAFDAAQAANLLLIVGEFSSVGVNYANPIDYQSIMQLAQEKQVGWLWWWWRHGDDGHALTDTGAYGDWVNVGEGVVVTSDYGIEKTSQKTYYLENGTCR